MPAAGIQERDSLDEMDFPEAQRSIREGSTGEHRRRCVGDVGRDAEEITGMELEAPGTDNTVLHSGGCAVEDNGDEDAEEASDEEDDPTENSYDVIMER